MSNEFEVHSASSRCDAGDLLDHLTFVGRVKSRDHPVRSHKIGHPIRRHFHTYPVIPRGGPWETALHNAVVVRPRLKAYLASGRRVPFKETGIFRRYRELDG